ncbi:retrovirus-related Pol polyprotein from transposon TNT 1-94 [Trichonephila clavipes]|nr:retrovirus-related Pol polyprotein from transposon TNT 1-94 [Trichonephila clavipes]
MCRDPLLDALWLYVWDIRKEIAPRETEINVSINLLAEVLCHAGIPHRRLLLLCAVRKPRIVVSIGWKAGLTQDPVLEVNNLAAQEVVMLCHGDQTKRPFELYTGVKPSILHFKKFGSTVYVGIPRPQRNKFDSKAKKGILVGYAFSTKGYRIWIPEEDKVVESCNVSFSQINQNSSYSEAVLVPEIPDVKEDVDKLVDSVEIGREVLDENLPSSSLQSTHQMVPQSQEADSSESEDDHGDKSSISSPPEVIWTRKVSRRADGSRNDIYYYVEGMKGWLRSRNEVKQRCAEHNVTYDKDLFDLKGS